ncbi:histidine kinase [Pelomonas sp. SE-A7]|uniref:sensor histidine kinase n=1 Tax=Pelomonas sp. SE-A7 TaxID=3054953 RepID=UPI00259C81DE|nr:histidine kinase [Pelomonas sp. SE-A7]MDM4768045.1 histidine kinase [Pelomonas sp. SE-A7]
MPVNRTAPLSLIAYAVLMAAMALLLSLAELQHYLTRGGHHAWEPFVWEFSSVALTAPLGLAVYRWHKALLGKPWLVQCLRHALGALAFMLIHVGGMFALRFAAYAFTDVRYEPGSALSVLGYEAGKDLVSYAGIVAVCHGLLHYFETQRLRVELAEARLARLAEQIQPHFLFNTLNLISSVMYEDVAKADRLVCELSTLLRHALDAQQKPLHSLDEELALVQPYLSLMQARFGERLGVEIDASSEALRCQVPSLLLISPVENAVKHDVATTSGPVLLRIRAAVEAGELRLSVENSGKAPERDSREGAVGMRNLRERVAAQYGERGQVRLAARPEGGSALSIVIPA